MVKRERVRDERGQILVLTVLSMTVLLAMAALSIDASFMFDKRNRLYAAADAAAKTGAAELARNSTISEVAILHFAGQEVKRHGLTPGACGSTTLDVTALCVHHPPLDGPFAGNGNFVEATISEKTSTFFGRVLGFTDVTPGARAVAGVSAPENCLVTLAPPGSTPVSLSIGNSTVTLNNCGVADGGDLEGANPNAEINGTPRPSVVTTGTCSGTCGQMGTLTQNGATPVNPLVGLVPPTVGGACIAGVANPLPPGCYTSIAASVNTLSPGIFQVTGLLNIGNLTGNGVMIYLTGAGQLTSANNNSLTLTAQTSGTYAGVAIFQDPSDSLSFSTGNNFDLRVTGAIYMPGADVDFPNSLSYVNTGCTLFIAHSLNIRNGNGGFSTSGCLGTFGSAVFLSATVAE